MRRLMPAHRWTIPVRSAPLVPLVLICAIILICPGSARAQSWNGSVSNQWNNGSNWTPNGIPASGASITITNTTGFTSVQISGINPTIANLTIGTVSTANTLTLDNDQSLTVAGGTSAGSIAIATGSMFNLDAGNNTTDLILGGTSGSTITLSGGGTLALSNSNNNRIYSTTGDTLINSAGNTIQGSGQIGINNGGLGFTLNNQGVINANQSNALSIAPSNAVANSGTLEATSGGTLNLGGTFNNTSAGVILSTGSGSTVNLGGTTGSTINGGTLTTSSGGLLAIGNSTLNGVTVSSGSTVSLLNDSAATLQGTITNNGTIAMDAGINSTDLHISGAVVLTGGGTVSMSGSNNNRIFGSGSDSLTNSSGNTIQGSGQIGINNGGLAFTLNNQGTIDANLTSTHNAALSIAPSNAVTNGGTLEATSGGTLNLGGTFNNAGGTILASGNDGSGTNSTVNLGGTTGSTINGGMLTTSGGGVLTIGNSTLNGVTVSSGSTVSLFNNSAATLQGTITNNGTIAMDAGNNTTDLHISGAVILSGGGSLSMSDSSNNRIYGSGTDTLTNSAGNTIQGSGQIGINNGGDAFTLNNQGIINANQSTALSIAPSKAVANSGTLEATSNGTLNLGGTFNNTSTGVIQSTGSSSTVNLGGTTASTINGGTLTTSGGGALNIGGSTLNGVTVSSGSTISLLNNSAATLQNTITTANGATLAMDAGNNTTDLHVSGAVILSGGGSLSMSDSSNNRIYGSGTDTLTNSAGNTIQGSGQIGINNGGDAFTLNNQGIINANQSVALQIAPTTAVANSGTLEATTGGTLNLIGTFNNSSAGLILSTRSGSTVNLNGATITGGTLTTTSGGLIQNNGSATLDGSTSSPTISSGSTLTLLNNTTTTLVGTIINNGTIAQNAGNNSTDIHLSGVVTLDGDGALVMSNSSNNRIFGVTNNAALINGANHTIEGAGQIGINNGGLGFTLTNNGTIVANQPTTLSIAPSGNTTNNGTFQANSGSLLFMNGTLTNYSPSTSTLTGGTYNAFSGTIELSQASKSGGQVIANNAATILLDGSSAKIADGSGNDIVRGFLATNSGSFTIQNGANVTTASGGLISNGTVTIGANSTLTSATLTNTGTVQGIGTLSGNLYNDGGTVMAGLPGTVGTLHVTGNYTDPFAHVDIQIGPGGAGLLDLGGTGSFGSTLFDVNLLPGASIQVGDEFEVVATAGGVLSDFSNSTYFVDGYTFQAELTGGGNDISLLVTGASVPEPASIVMLGLGVLGAGAFVARSRSRKAARR
jgi:PEP-CTERM motif